MKYKIEKKIIKLNKKITKLQCKIDLQQNEVDYFVKLDNELETKMNIRQAQRIEKIKERAEIKQQKLIKKKEAQIRYRALNEPPHLTTLEEIGNAVTHGVGALLAIAALVLMLLKSNTSFKVAASLIYGITMFLLMLDSCLYHAWRTGSTVKRIYRRFDYCSIYLLIGGTFAPLFLIYTSQPLGWILCIVQWVLIITGITFISVFGPGRLKWFHFPMYFILGWSGLAFLPFMAQNNMPLMICILAGGVIYSLGMIPFVKRGVKAAHFIWHFFVLAGAITQFMGIYLCLYC